MALAKQSFFEGRKARTYRVPGKTTKENRKKRIEQRKEYAARN